MLGSTKTARCTLGTARQCATYRTSVSIGGRTYSRTITEDPKGLPVFEQWLIHGAGHAWSGGSAVGSTQTLKVPTLREKCCGSFSLIVRPDGTPPAGPRGLSKEKLRDATWLKDVAPSTDLRKWFNHRPERWKQFCIHYAAELDRNPDAITKLRAMCERGSVTLLYSARDMEHNQALALAEYLGAHR